jgi:FtsP/CotA-like multicopper oxidase with cupredoxin domain
MLSRRQLMIGTGSLAVAAVSGRAGRASAAPSQPFSLALPIPRLIDARRHNNSLEITASEGMHAFVRGVLAPTYGYSSDYLGPVIRVYRGDTVQMVVENKIGRDTTIHWHGLLVPGSVDGGPQNLIRANDTWRPALTIDQPEATAWFHPHPHHDTARQVYMGLVGLMYIEDGTGERLGLPRSYGVDDLPLVVQDRQLNGAGQLVYSGWGPSRMMGMRGDTILVNGAVAPNATVPAGIVRLRLLNGANARNFNLSFSDNRPFAVIASDGGYLAKPVATRSLIISPGERFEVLVDFSDGKPALLQTAEDDIGMGMMMGPGMMGRRSRRGSEFDAIMRFETDSALPVKARSMPRTLVNRPAPDPSRAVARRELTLEMGMMMFGTGAAMGINGRPFDPKRIDMEVKLGTSEIWSVAPIMMAHPFHIHGAMFDVLSLDGRAPPAHLAGSKDTILLEDQPAELLVSFTRPATRQHPFVYHCHILEHEGGGMMGQYIATS